VCVFFGKNTYSGTLPIFKLGDLGFLLLSCKSSLYILDINPLSDISFADIFSHLVGCLLFCRWFLCCAEWNVFVFIFLSVPLGYRATSMKAEIMSLSEGPPCWVFMKCAHLSDITNVVLLHADGE